MRLINTKTREKYNATEVELPNHAGWTVRSVEPWVEIMRHEQDESNSQDLATDDAHYFTVYADSAFASVTAAKFLATKMKTLFVGSVKTCKMGFPMAALETLVGDASVKEGRKTVVQKKARGTTAVYTATIDGVRMIAVGVRAARKLSTMIATTGSTDPVDIPAAKLAKSTSEQKSAKIFKIPRLVRTYFDSAGCIDQHNQLRQGFLCLEDRMRTKRFHIRMFQSWLGTIVVDAFKTFYYKKTCASATILEFTRELLTQLRYGTVFCEYVDPGPQSQPSSSSSLRTCFGSLHQVVSSTAYTKIMDHPVRGNCRICNTERVATCCPACSNALLRASGKDSLNAKTLFLICDIKDIDADDCYRKHLKQLYEE